MTNKMNTQNYPSWLVSVEQAKRLKKIGFDEPCQFFLPIKMYEDFDTKELEFDFQKENHNESVDYWSIPSNEQVIEWFKEKELIGVIDYFFDMIRDKPLYKYEIKNIIGQVIFINKEVIETYNEAIGLLINQLIETYKTNKIL
jgi:hypothetical protein